MHHVCFFAQLMVQWLSKYAPWLDRLRKWCKGKCITKGYKLWQGPGVGKGRQGGVRLGGYNGEGVGDNGKGEMERGATGRGRRGRGQRGGGGGGARGEGISRMDMMKCLRGHMECLG